MITHRVITFSRHYMAEELDRAVADGWKIHTFTSHNSHDCMVLLVKNDVDDQVSV